MTEPRDPDRLIRAFLEEGPVRLSDRTVERTLGEIHRSHRRAVLGPWRSLPMSRATLAAIAAVLVIGVVAIFAMRATTPVGNLASPGPNASGLVASSATPTGPTPSASAAPASPSPTIAAKGTILYELAGTIYAIAADGTNNRSLVTGQSCCIALAPDGHAFIYGTVMPDGRLEVGYQGLAGDTEPDLVPPAGLSFAPGAWSTNFDLAFAGTSDSSPSKNGVYLSIDNGGGLLWGDIKRLTAPTGGAIDTPIAFSPDSSRLLFIRGTTQASQTGDLYVINKDGSGLRRLTPKNVGVEVDDAFGAGASWSPDGTQIAFAGFGTAPSNSISSIYVVGATSGTAKAITTPNNYVTSARWSPNASWIAFDQPLTGSRHYQYLIHPDGSGLVQIGQGLNVGVCCSQWSPDGTMLVTQGGLTSDIVDLYIMNADGSGEVQLTHNPGRYNSYFWSSATP
jgi:Tol biopolymer transport system component